MGYQGFQRGHPRWGGRKKGVTYKCKTYADAPIRQIKEAAMVRGPAIIAELWKIVSDKFHKKGNCSYRYDTDARIKAMSILLERAYGRPAQEVTATVKKTLEDFSDQEIAIVLGLSLEDIYKQDTTLDENGLPIDPDKIN